MKVKDNMSRSKCDHCPRVRALEAKIERLERRIAELTAVLDEARRASRRQAAPFSKGEPKANPKRPGRKPGKAYGRRAFRPRPRRVDEDYDVPLPERCTHPGCGGRVHQDGVADQYQEDIPPVRPITRRFRVHYGRCGQCGRRVQGRHPLQTSDALGAASVQIGPEALGTAAHMNKELGVTYGKIAVFFQTRFTFAVARSTWCRANLRLAQKARPTVNAMVVAVRHALVVYADETGWKIAGLPAWLWAFVTEWITVYVIRRSRGFDVIEEILTAEFKGVLGRDGWSPYRKLLECAHQTCLGHLLVRCRKMLEVAVAGEAHYPLTVRGVLKDALALRDRRGGMSEHGFAVARGRLDARADRLLESRLTHEPNARLQKHLANERDALFTFLRREDVEATDWRGEQAMRPAVVNRKTSGGSRSDLGADAQGILTSVFRTARQQGREPVSLMVKLQRSPHPLDLGLARGPGGRPRLAPLPRGQPEAIAA
jgi:transposase